MAAAAALSASPAPSPFASLLRRSRFTTHDPLISQIYTTHGGHASRGDWGLKRPLALRKDGKYITLQSTDSRQQVTEWQGARQPYHWIKRWEELGAEAEASPRMGWEQRGGGGDKVEELDSEFAEVEAPASLEINDALFCQHFKEVCTDCGVDTREENDAFFGFDPIDREGLEAPAATVTKDGTYQCKKHGSPSCNQCYGWKKQITRARTAAKKAGKKA